MRPPASVGLVHDYLLVMRGAERTFASMADCWPEARVNTLLYDERGTQGRFAKRSVATSYLQRLNMSQKGFRRALPLFPRAAESLPLADHELVVSSSSAFAHGVRPAKGAVHVCYCHSPFRYAWHERGQLHRDVPRVLRGVAGHMLDRIRDWDVAASRRVDHYIANSEVTRRRIQEFYGRESTVVHPPVEVERFAAGTPQDYALVVSEIVSHKRIDVALEAARLARHPIKVVGTGPDLERLSERYGDSAEFVGRVSDDELVRLHQGARVFLMANTEEFGIAAVEAQASGRPVIAAAAGGALETVVPGVTGVHVPIDDAEAMAEALLYTDFERFSPEAIRLNAERFSSDAFRARLGAEVDRIWSGSESTSPVERYAAPAGASAFARA
jgi:glycosyltransferase involved in cell wall biosynthesis